MNDAPSLDTSITPPLDQQTLQFLADAMPQKVWIADAHGYGSYFNQQWFDYTGLTFDEAKGEGWQQVIHPEDLPAHLHIWQHALATGEDFQVEVRLRSKEGNYRWHTVRGAARRDATGTVLLWVGNYSDTDDRKRAEQMLKTSEENFRTLAEMVPQLVWIARPNALHEYVNQRWQDYTGLTPEQARDARWSHLQFIHPDDRESSLALWQHAQNTSTMYEHEERLRDSQTGAYRWFLTRGMPVRDEVDQVIKWFGTSTDIDDQKRTEEALRQSQQRIRALIDSNIIGILSIEGEKEVVVDANEAFLHMTGYTREDVSRKTLTRAGITTTGYEQLFRNVLRELNAYGQSVPFETELVCKDGSRLPILAGGVLVQAHPREITAFILDNSARKELEQRKDDFISMASHELKTPLTPLKMQVSLLKKRAERLGQHDATVAFAKMEAQVKRLERLIAELLDVSKIQAGRLEYARETVNLDALLHELAETMQQASTTHTIVVRGSAQTCLIGDQDRLEQVFTNLLSNAIKYSPDATTVEIEISHAEKMVTVSVRDHGIGIPREQQQKVFERFYRAFDPSNKAFPGLGMGLYIVAEIVHQHGGTITVDSEVGKGSTFHVMLPYKQADFSSS